jgi:ornithine cyclodeaminase/alanine dehydrogenase-like protein (mu-crystallin family)
VDSRAVAGTEGGDFLLNGFDVSGAVEMGEVILGTPARRSPADITIFESHGLAMQDLVCALHVLRAEERRGGGRAVEWSSPRG